MSKISLTNLVNLNNQTTAVNAINANNAVLTSALDNTLSRDGTTPNQMGASLDMNSNRILNLPTALSVTEPVTLSQMTAALVANGNINTGLTGVPVSAAMQPVVNAATIANAQLQLGISTGTGSSPISTFDTRTQAAAATLPSTVNAFRTSGYTTAGDGGGALYTRAVGSTVGGFQSADTAWWQLSEPILDIRMLGASTGATDNQTAIQNAITLGQSSSRSVKIPLGLFNHTGTLLITGAITIFGVNRNGSLLVGTGGAVQQQITIQTNSAVLFRDFGITTNITKTGGWGILISGSGGSPENDRSIFDSLSINGQVTGLDFETAAYWTVQRCMFEAPPATPGNQIIVRNNTTADAGSSYILNNSFIGGNSGSSHVIWQSSGGLHVLGNYFLGAGTTTCCLNLNSVAGSQTGVIIVNGNAFDGPSGTGVSITTSAAANSVLTNITVSGNTFDGSPATAFVYVNRGAGSTLGGITVTGNTMVCNAAGVIGVNAQSVGSLICNSNMIVGGSTAIAFGSAVDSGTIVGNLVAGAAISNSSGSNVLVASNH